MEILYFVFYKTKAMFLCEDANYILNLELNYSNYKIKINTLSYILFIYLIYTNIT
jgi:hypothetical protein